MEPLTPNINSDSSTSSSSSQHETNRKKRRRKPEQDPESNSATENRKVATKKKTIRWRTDKDLLIYSSKLIDALHRVRSRNNNLSSVKPVRGGEIRDMANQVLAVSAKGTTRWSRAIIASRLKAVRRSIAIKHKKAKKNKATENSRLINKEVTGKSRLPAVEKKVKTLSRLVPGCRKVSLTNLLEEASDYIAALQMQVKAMTALSEILSGAVPASERLGLLPGVINN
ncbi:hypothetical protein ACFE04_028871 [Oxalis oulophora]